jgi:DmsE family decaheme c-type cytochrome
MSKGQEALMRVRTWLPIALALAAFLVFGVDRAMAVETAVDPEECAACHEDHVATFMQSPHSALDSEGLAEMAGVTGSCAACHGDATQHMEEGGGEGTIFSFAPDNLPSTLNETCLTCHAQTHPGFQASAHARLGVTCVDCHSIHPAEGEETTAEGFRSALDTGRVSDGCQECHGDVFAQFEFNERHRLQEGTMECTTCHDPHQAQDRMMLGAFKQEQCLTCHRDKGGPFVFEHGSQKTEGCTACHSPHGSPNRHMLAFQNVAELCYSCHALVPGFHTRFTLESQCTSCHSTIHGSNFDPFFLK